MVNYLFSMFTTSIFVLLILYYAIMIFIVGPQYLTLECIKGQVENIILKRFSERYGCLKQSINAEEFCRLAELPVGAFDKIMLPRFFIDKCCKIFSGESISDDFLKDEASKICKSSIDKNTFFKGDLEEGLRGARRSIQILKIKLLWSGYQLFIKYVFCRVLDAWGRYVTLTALISILLSFIGWSILESGMKSVNQLIDMSIANLSKAALFSLMIATVFETVRMVRSFKKHRGVAGTVIFSLILVTSILIHSGIFIKTWFSFVSSLKNLGQLWVSVIIPILIIEIILINLIFRTVVFRLYSIGKLSVLCYISILLVLVPFCAPILLDKYGALGFWVFGILISLLSGFLVRWALIHFENLKIIRFCRNSSSCEGENTYRSWESYIIFIFSVTLLLAGFVFLLASIFGMPHILFWALVISGSMVLFITCGAVYTSCISTAKPIMSCVKYFKVPAIDKSLSGNRNIRLILAQKYLEDSLMK